jgi:hypothetical protein
MMRRVLVVTQICELWTDWFATNTSWPSPWPLIGSSKSSGWM